MALAGLRAAACGGAAGVRAVVAAGFAEGGGPGVIGIAAPSGWSPRTASVLIFFGSLLGSVPFPAFAVVGAPTLAVDVGFAFWFNGGNTTRGPDLELTSTV